MTQPTLNRRTLLQCLGSAAMAPSLLPMTAGAKQKPNVLFIMADDLSTALSGYGHPQCKTPNLDRLAQRGTTFTRAYCQFPVCGPSRASIMTGQYPGTNGVTGNGGRLADDAQTMPWCFREADYWTGRVSKIYHMGVPGHIFTGDNGTDHAPSWDERYNVSVMETLTPGKAEDVMLHDSTPLYEDLREEWQAVHQQGGRFLIPEGNHQGSDFVIVETDGGDEVNADGVAASKAIELLQQWAESDQPFFMGVGFVRPHVPLVAPRQAFDGYDAEAMILPDFPEDDLDDIPDVAQGNTNQRKYKLTELAQKKSLRGYYASITYMDQQVGRLLDELERLGLEENTVVVFVSDHGYHLGEHSMWQKLSLFEESARVPLIVSVPGQVKQGSMCDDIVELTDLLPTILDVSDLPIPEQVQGASFADVFSDPAFRFNRQDALIRTGNGYALRTDQWAYMMYFDSDGEVLGTMLYDMQNDPRQFTNLVGDPAYAETEAELRSRLLARIDAANL